jgi:hypothetical protein
MGMIPVKERSKAPKHGEDLIGGRVLGGILRKDSPLGNEPNISLISDKSEVKFRFQGLRQEIEDRVAPPTISVEPPTDRVNHTIFKLYIIDSEIGYRRRTQIQLQLIF